MRLMSRTVEAETRMPTLEDLHKLAKDTNERVDRMEEKLDALHAEVSVAVGALMEHFQGK